jgi:hypothetical protein
MIDRVNITPESKSPTMKMGLDVPSIFVRGRITVSLAAVSADVTRTRVAKVLTLDESGSTTMRDYAMSDGRLIFPVEVASAKQLVSRMNDDDLLGIVTFSDSQVPSGPARVIMPLTRCDAAGRDRLIMALDRLRPNNGGTDYVAGLQAAYGLLQSVTDMARSIDFLSDGACNRDVDPLPLAEEIRNEGVVICCAGIQDTMSGDDEARLKAMSGGTNFQACLEAELVSSFLAGALRKAKNAALTNVNLLFEPKPGVTVKVLDRTLKNGQRGYVAGTTAAGNAEVNLGELGPNEEIEIYTEISLVPPKFPPTASFEPYALGNLVVTALCPSEGVTTPTEMGRIEFAQNFARASSGTTNPEVAKLEAEWTAAAALDQASKTTDAGKQQDILGKAADKVRRATQIYADDDSLAGALTDLDALKKESASKGGGAAAKSAGRKTQVFVDD